MEPARNITTDPAPTAIGLAPAAVFGLLANMFLCKPTAVAVSGWRDLMAAGVPDILDELNEAVNVINLKSAEEMQDLLWDFTRLFIGPYRLPCPPWESVYTSGKRLLLQEAADAVRAIYGQANVEIGDAGILPDHVGAELNFAGLLLEKIATASIEEKTCRRLITQFTQEHLSNWIPRFAADLEKAAATPVYRALARSTTAAVSRLLSEFCDDSENLRGQS